MLCSFLAFHKAFRFRPGPQFSVLGRQTAMLCAPVCAANGTMFAGQQALCLTVLQCLLYTELSLFPVDDKCCLTSQDKLRSGLPSKLMSFA